MKNLWNVVASYVKISTGKQQSVEQICTWLLDATEFYINLHTRASALQDMASGSYY